MFDSFLVLFSLLHTIEQKPAARLGATFKLIRISLYSPMMPLRSVNVGAMDSQRILGRKAFEAFSTFVELPINIVLPFFRKSIEYYMKLHYCQTFDFEKVYRVFIPRIYF